MAIPPTWSGRYARLVEGELMIFETLPAAWPKAAEDLVPAPADPAAPDLPLYLSPAGQGAAGDEADLTAATPAQAAALGFYRLLPLDPADEPAPAALGSYQAPVTALETDDDDMVVEIVGRSAVTLTGAALDARKERLAAEVTWQLDRRLGLPFSHGGKLYDADAASVASLNLAATVAAASLQAGGAEPAGGAWPDPEGDGDPLTRAELLALATALNTRRSGLHARAADLRRALAAGDELDLSDWPIS